MALNLPLSKPGDTHVPLKLNLAKGERFTVELAWDSKHDLDAHCLLMEDTGAGNKVTSMEKVLSTYNSRKTNRSGVLVTNPNGSFSTPCGSLTHSGDARDGTLTGVDETITIEGSKVPMNIVEIPIFVTIHPASSGLFKDVKEATIKIKDDSGKELCSFRLTSEFASFNAVQMGSLLVGANGWEFSAVGVGFNGDFNSVLGSFS
jgi:tellurium resistance protein TerD